MLATTGHGLEHEQLNNSLWYVPPDILEENEQPKHPINVHRKAKRPEMRPQSQLIPGFFVCVLVYRTSVCYYEFILNGCAVMAGCSDYSDGGYCMAVPLNNDDEFGVEQHLPLTPELIETINRGKNPVPPEPLTSRDLKKVRRIARGIINGYLIIDIENGRAINIREVRTRHHSLTSRSNDEED
jgi:hypothetical protein